MRVTKALHSVSPGTYRYIQKNVALYIVFDDISVIYVSGFTSNILMVFNLQRDIARLHVLLITPLMTFQSPEILPESVVIHDKYRIWRPYVLHIESVFIVRMVMK